MKVTFEPDGETIQAEPGRVLGLILRAGRPIGYACRGRGVCVACRVWVEGPQSAIDSTEAALLKQFEERQQGEALLRIACLAKVTGDAKIRADYW